MFAQAWLQIILTVLAIFLVVMGQPTKLDRIFDPIDNAIYFLIGRRVAAQAMTWRTYTIHMLVTNLVMAIIIYLVLSFQNYLPLNQLNFPAVDPLLAFNTTISFITNTNWQAYGGESALSNFSQMGPSPFRCSHRRRLASSWQWPGSG
jgi:K+-transporting ATPase ATPase A chain